ncbi:MAG: hypothetical protein ACO1PB_17770 [Ramlibacter sp.]
MSIAIDVGIGLAIVFALVALMCSGLQEMLSAALNLRGKTLWEGVESMLQANDPSRPPPVAGQSRPLTLGEELEVALRSHPLVRTLVPDKFGLTGLLAWLFKDRRPTSDVGSTRPSYMQASTFATVLADCIGQRWGGGRGRFDDFGMAVAAMPEGPLRFLLQGMVHDARGDPAKLRATVEAWFDETMVRVGGWYKRRIQVLLMVIGLLVAAVMNIDAIHIAGALSTQSDLRNSLAARATQMAAVPTAGAPQNGRTQVEAAHDELRKSRLPMGWEGWQPIQGWSMLLPLGWLVTAFAASFGAPFWFDLINKLAPLRSSGAKPAAAPEPLLANVGSSTSVGAQTHVSTPPEPIPFRAALNDYEADTLTPTDILQIKRILGVAGTGGETATIDQPTRDAIRAKQQQMNWPASGELSARWVEQLRTGLS